MRLEELHAVAGGVVNQNLVSSHANYDLIAKAGTARA
jgi:hypothetical protein